MAIAQFNKARTGEPEMVENTSMSYQGQSHRCQAVNAHGSQCRERGEVNATHPARLCRQHQHTARNDCLRLTAEGQKAVDHWRAIEEEHERLTARYYCVTVDRTLSDGRRMLDYPVSPYYATPEQARAAREALLHAYPDAQVLKGEAYCDSDAERDTIMAKVVQPKEAVAEDANSLRDGLEKGAPDHG